MNNMLDSLDKLLNGALAERFKGAMEDVIANIIDPNTEADKMRKINFTVSIKPNDNRDIASFKIDAKTTLTPPKALETTIMFGADEDGVIVAREYNPNVAQGQIDMSGKEHNNITPLSKIK